MLALTGTEHYNKLQTSEEIWENEHENVESVAEREQSEGSSRDSGKREYV